MCHHAGCTGLRAGPTRLELRTVRDAAVTGLRVAVVARLVAVELPVTTCRGVDTRRCRVGIFSVGISTTTTTSDENYETE
jgi:hypothetical protein